MTMTLEDESDFEEFSEEITLMERDYPLLGAEVDSDDQIRCESALGEANAGKTANENQKLYPGARVTIGAVMVLLTLFASRYDFTGKAISHLLQIITLILPTRNILLDIL